MRAVLLILMMVTSLGLLSHDLKIALFEIREHEGSLVCQARVDRVEFLKSLGAPATEQALTAYLEEHLALSFNGQLANLNVEDVRLSDLYVVFTANIETTDPKATTITMKNTLLVNELKGHENIVRIDLHDRVRSFRFKKDRPEITINY